MTAPYCNFLTPPSNTKDKFSSVIIIDADWNDVDSVAIWCKTASVCLNIYLYHENMLDEPWLINAVNISDHLIINTCASSIDHIKKPLLKTPHAWYYGKENFLGNSQRVTGVLDWFVKHHGN